MAILWCGGEQIDFPNGTVSVSTTGSYRRTDYSREALYGGDLFWTDKVLDTITSAWLSYHLHYYGNTSSIYDGMHLGLVGEDGITGYWVWKHLGKVYLRKYDGGYSTAAIESGTSWGSGGAGQNAHVDMCITNYGVSGNIKVYTNGVEVIDYTADLTISGLSGFTRVGGYGSSTYVGNLNMLSEIIVATEDTRLMSLKTLAPNAAGDVNDWTGAYTDIDETGLSSSDIIYTTDIGDDFQANLTGMPSGTYKVKAVKVIISAADEAGVMGVKAGVKTNSAVHLGNAHSLGAAWVVIEELYNTNPETASAFTSGEIDALQLAIRTDSTTTTSTTTTT